MIPEISKTSEHLAEGDILQLSFVKSALSVNTCMVKCIEFWVIGFALIPTSFLAVMTVFSLFFSQTDNIYSSKGKVRFISTLVTWYCQIQMEMGTVVRAMLCLAIAIGRQFRPQLRTLMLIGQSGWVTSINLRAEMFDARLISAIAFCIASLFLSVFGHWLER